MTSLPSDEPEPEITGMYETPDGHKGFLYATAEVIQRVARNAGVVDLTTTDAEGIRAEPEEE